MDLVSSEAYLTDKGWDIQEVKSKEETISIIDAWTMIAERGYSLHRFCSPLGSGFVDEIIYKRKNSKDNTRLSFRYIKSAPNHRPVISGQAIIRVISQENIYQKALDNNFNLIENHIENGAFEKVYEKEGIIFYLSKVLLKEACHYELVVVNKDIYKRSCEGYEWMKKVTEKMNN